MFKLLTISKNTFIETLRQPIYAVIIIFALLLMLLAPAVSMYTLDEDINLLRELGLSTLFLAGLFISVFAATGAITEEIESGTITTILSKPISRPAFVIGKFIGISAAVALAHILITMAFLMVTRHGVIETAADEIDWTVIVAASIAILGGLSITAFMNYTYGWSFPATGVVVTTLFMGFAILFLVFVDRDWHFNPAENHFQSFDILASVLLLLALLTLIALAILFSTRFNEVLTLTFCVGFFLLGLISDWIFGHEVAKPISNPVNIIILLVVISFNAIAFFSYFYVYFRYVYKNLPRFFTKNLLGILLNINFTLSALSWVLFLINLVFFKLLKNLPLFFSDSKIFMCKVGSILTPNLQFFWVSDAIYETGTVPGSYIMMAAVYSALYTAGILVLAVAFFQRRQVG